MIQCKGINRDRLSQEVAGRTGVQSVGEKNKVESYCFKMYYIFSCGMLAHSFIPSPLKEAAGESL